MATSTRELDAKRAYYPSTRRSNRPIGEADVRRGWLPWLGLLTILLAATLIRVRLFAGFVGLDDAEYARFAFRIAKGLPVIDGYTGPPVFPLRVGVILPTAALFHWFGLGEWTLVLYPFVLSLLGIVCAYVCAARLFGSTAGLVAATLVAIFPWDIDGATKLLPDLPAAFYAAVAFTTLVLLSTTGERRRRMLFGGGALIGLSLGLSWLCKESVAYLAPFFIVWMVITVRQHGASHLYLWGGVAAGSLAILVGEMIVYHASTGDFLFRLHEVERNYREWPSSFFTEGSSFGWTKGTDYRHALLDRLLVSGPRVILLNPTFLFLPFIALAAATYGWLRRDRAFLLPSLWLGTLVLMFNFASSSTDTYLPLALHNRYLSLIYFPAIVLVAGFVVGTVLPGRRVIARPRRPVSRWMGMVTLSVIAWVGLRQLAWSVREPPHWLAEVRALRSHVKPETVLYADALSLRAFEFFAGYPRNTAWKDLKTIASPEDIGLDSYVLIYPPGIAWLEREIGIWVRWPAPGPTDPTGYLKGRFKTPPPSWATVWKNGEVALYRVSGNSAAPPTGGPR